MSGLFYNQPLRNCCFCLSLKSGCRLLGSLSTFVCTLELVYACQRLNSLLDKERHCLDNLIRSEEVASDPPYPLGVYYNNTCAHLKVVQFMLIIDFIIYVIGFNGSVMLLYGIKTRQPRLFCGWLLFCGLVIFSNFFSILVWHNVYIVTNLLVVIILAYLFRIVRSYYIQLIDEREGRLPPPVSATFPPDTDSRVFLQTRPSSFHSDPIKDDPPPPYPGLTSIPTSGSIESQPPPYSAIDSINPNYESHSIVETHVTPSCSNALTSIGPLSHSPLHSLPTSESESNSLSQGTIEGSPHNQSPSSTHNKEPSVYGSAEWNPSSSPQSPAEEKDTNEISTNTNEQGKDDHQVAQQQQDSKSSNI